MLVLRDPGGEPLDRLLGPPLEAGRFLRLAIALSGALGRLHQRGLVHKDIKPTNIVVNSATDQVWLTGFGIASRLPREHQLPEPPEFIAGTLPYMAPEQTGRMNRSIDSRSDLYSLGITFYEMLTGTLPFAAADPMEWVHCHIARRPAPPDERVAGVPRGLAAIVMKLLAKTAEERYQTAAGLESDLRRCLAEWEVTGRIDPFPLGAHDVPDRLLIPEKLYGRQREIDTLLASFDRVVANGTPELVLVSGYPGIGKSSVVNELHKVLVPPHGLFASGKFDQYKRDIPYATLAQAFQGLVRPILGQSETALGRWRDCLREALGPNGQLIVNLVPELELVIGKQPPVPDLPPRDAQHRFQLAVRRFLGAFAKPEQPLALFLDDLQWLDAATLDLLEHLATHSEVRHLLLVVAYRDNEVGPSHPLLWMLEAIRNAGARVREIVLAPLGLDDVGELVANSLHCGLKRAKPLAQLVQEKTGGNPFFAIQFFTAVADEGLLAFDPNMLAWQWNMDRIRAKNYTNNVVDLMAAKLKRLSSKTQEALKQLACLGNVVPTATLAMVYGTTEEAIHAALWEAVQAGLVFHHGTTWKFLHDRIQQAAYSLIPDDQRANVHLHIGRALLAGMRADQLTEHLFDIANQFNRGAARLNDRDEKARVATIDLRAGRKAKASAAYASACAHLAAGMALLHESDWDSQYELMFSLWLENAECEFLRGKFDKAERLILELMQRAESKVDKAAVYHLKVQYHFAKSENPRAVDSALTCLRLFGIDLPAHPTLEQVQAEYEAAWQILNGRPIESLIDLPPMTDQEQQAALQVLAVLGPPAYFTDFRLYCLQVCRMANVSMQYGASGAAAPAYGYLGIMLAAVFHRYRDAYRFAKLACDLVEKHGFIANQSRVYLAMAAVAFWTQPIANVIDFIRTGFRIAIETGDLYFACYGMHGRITSLLQRNDPLDVVWRESEMALDLAREAKYGDTSHIIISQQRFIATMQGRTATFSSFSDTRFDEARFEAQLTADCMSLTIAWYWILKLKARFLSGDYAEALAAADKAKPLLSATFVLIELLDYFYYTALTVSALYENASADEQQRWRDLLTEHREQLREWTENYPPTFADKYQLVLAEIARLEGRDADAMRLYEQAIQSAREHGFVQNEGVAHELAAGFYLSRGSTTAARTHLENARGCFTRWGAIGKVQQLDRRYPRPRERTAAPLRTGTIDTLIEKLDVASVVKASQAVSGEIELGKLIETLLRIAIEHAGAERGLLILFRGDEARIAAEATTGCGQVTLRETAVSSAELPVSVLQYVIRTQKIVILDDGSVQNPFSADEYIRHKHARSALCLPLVKQGRLIGVLYLENNLASHVFTPARNSVLELLASQAAVSLENARLYNDLQEREAKVRRLVDSNIIGIVIGDMQGRIIEANQAFLDIVGYTRQDLVSGRLRWTELTPADWRDADDQALAELKMFGTVQPREKEYFRKDGSRVPILIARALFEWKQDEGVAFVLDMTDRKRAEEMLRASEQRYRHLFEQMPIAMWQVDGRGIADLFAGLRAAGVADLGTYLDRDPDFVLRLMNALVVEEVNEHAIKMFGAKNRNQLFGPSAFFWQKRPDTFRRAMESRFRGLPTFQEETKLVTLDGREIDVLFTAAWLESIGERGIGLGGAIDITDRIRAQERLQQVQADFAHAARLSVLGEIAASIAHEVNQPLTGVVTYGGACLRWLDGEVPRIDQARSAVEQMIGSARHASDVIARIRALSRKGGLETAQFDINKAIDDVIALIREEIHVHGVSLRLDLETSLPPVDGDRVQLQQVIMNLLMNSIQAMSAVTGRHRELQMRSREHGADQILVAVEDSGTGIEPENVDRVFNAFFTTKPDGMGMGLSICRSIIEQHGGRIWATRNSGTGFTFQFTLPVYRETAS
jgi:PAS domain S-box-containing protein